MNTSLILTTEDYPPFNIKGNSEKPISGISTDIVRELMKRAGITIDIACNRALPDALIARLNGLLKRMRADGTIARILARC